MGTTNRAAVIKRKLPEVELERWRGQLTEELARLLGCAVDMLPVMISKRRAAKYLGVDPETLEKWRRIGRYPELRICKGIKGIEVPSECLIDFRLDHYKKEFEITI